MESMSWPKLRFKEDRRTISFVLIYFTLVASGFVFWNSMELWAHALLLVPTCVFAFLNAVITHNVIHVPLFEERKHNRWFQSFLSIAYGHPVSAYVRGHNLSHHMHKETNKDVMRSYKARYRWNLLNILLFFFIVMPDVKRANTKYAKAMKTERPAWHAQFRSEALWVLGAMLVLLVLNWKAFLVYFVLPHGYAAWGILGINFLQHDGTDPDHPYNHSRDFTGRLLNWMAFNNGYHCMHHIRAGIHWSELPAAHKERVAPYLHPNLQQKSMIAYLWRAFIYPGKRLRYDGQPLVLPPVGEDEDWIPKRSETPDQVSLGAVR